MGRSAKSISYYYYQCAPDESKRLTICVRFRGAAPNRNSIGGALLDSLPIVLSLNDERIKATNIPDIQKQLCADLYASPQSGEDIDSEIRSLSVYLGELGCGYLSKIKDFSPVAGNHVAALMTDGLIYLNLSGGEIDPSGVGLGHFGILKLRPSGCRWGEHLLLRPAAPSVE